MNEMKPETINQRLDGLSGDERSLLLYMESMAVENGGQLDSRRLNDSDRATLRRWDEEGFVSWRRIAYATLQTLHNSYVTSFVTLSDAAWTLAHAERRARCARLQAETPVNALEFAATVKRNTEE